MARESRDSEKFVQKSTDPKSFVPKTTVPVNRDRLFMKKADAVADKERLKERDARKEAAGKAFDEEENAEAKAKEEEKARAKAYREKKKAEKEAAGKGKK